jgi:CRP-like cAMP-binding protein
MRPPYPPIFEGLNDVDVHTALRKFEEREVPEGTWLIEEGQRACGLFCVLTGELEIRSRDTVLGLARSGDLVGEMALFQAGQRTASVVASAASRVLVLDQRGYEALRDTLHPLAHSLERRALHLQIARLRDTGDRIARLSQGAPPPPLTQSSWFFAGLASMFGRGGIFSVERVDPMAALRRCPIFADAPIDALTAIAAELKQEAFAEGAALCTEGEMGQSMFFLDEREVDVVVAIDAQRVQRLVTLRAGAAFGMVTLVQDRPRMSSCIARTRVVVNTLQRAGWLRLVEDPYTTGATFRRAMIRIVSEQLNYANAQVADFEQTAIQATPTEVASLVRASASVDAHGSHLVEQGSGGS